MEELCGSNKIKRRNIMRAYNAPEFLTVDVSILDIITASPGSYKDQGGVTPGGTPSGSGWGDGEDDAW